MAIAVADPSVSTVNQELGALVAGDLTACIDRVGLGRVHRGVPRVALAADGPPLISSDYMLIGHAAAFLTVAPSAYTAAQLQRS